MKPVSVPQEAEYEERLAVALGELLAAAWRRRYGAENSNAGLEGAGAAQTRETMDGLHERTRSTAPSQPTR